MSYFCVCHTFRFCPNILGHFAYFRPPLKNICPACCIKRTVWCMNFFSNLMESFRHSFWTAKRCTTSPRENKKSLSSDQSKTALGWHDVEKTLFSEEFDKTQHLLALVFSGLILEDKLFIFSTFQTGHLEIMIHENSFSCLHLGFSKENQQMQRN